MELDNRVTVLLAVITVLLVGLTIGEYALYRQTKLATEVQMAVANAVIKPSLVVEPTGEVATPSATPVAKAAVTVKAVK